MSSETEAELAYRTKVSIWVGVGFGLIMVGPLLLIWNVWPNSVVKIASAGVMGMVGYLFCDKAGRYLTRRKFGHSD